MYSTWKIAFDSAWAGPSWISWARRERSASWASTIRIWMSLGVAGPPAVVDQRGVAALEEQPRALEVALGELELGQLGLVAAELARTAGRRRARSAPRRGRRPRRPRRRSAARSASVGAHPAARGDLARSSRSMRRARRAGPASGRAVGVGLAVALADAAERVGAVANGRARFRMEPVEATFVAGAASPVRASIGVRSIRVAAHGQTISNARTSRRADRRRRPGPGPRCELVEAVGIRSRPVQDRRPAAVVVAHDDDEPRAGEAGRGEVERRRRASRRAGPGRGRRVRSRPARSGSS